VAWESSTHGKKWSREPQEQIEKAPILQHQVKTRRGEGIAKVARHAERVWEGSCKRGRQKGGGAFQGNSTERANKTGAKEKDSAKACGKLENLIRKGKKR